MSNVRLFRRFSLVYILLSQMKIPLQTAMVATMLCLLHQSRASDAVYLVERDNRAHGEAFELSIATDGCLVTDAGNTATFKSLSKVFTHWRAQGSNPSVTLVLYPRLKSNSDLKKIRHIVTFLRTNHVFAGITVEGVDTQPEKGL